MGATYDHKKIEKKWRDAWEKSGLYRAQDEGTQKSYVLDMFPYPSGEGLHVGHPKGYIATDVYSRVKRMQGHAVLHPMGWDAFGLPAENYAIKNKIHPRKAVEKNIAHFKEQLAKLGFNYDWSREINTTDPEYYRWTQWIFLKLFERGLAYESHEPINWCPSCQTGLSNEDLNDGKCERCGSEVEQRPMRQWVLRITRYADRLLEDLSLLPEWQEHIKESQRNWIGRSEGAEIDFSLANRSEKITVFTTRADTLFGATYIVLAPEHPFVEILLPDVENASDVRAYIEKTRRKTELERQESKEKTGVKLRGIRAINPGSQEEIPIYIADYVLAHYGTGAIMAVPAHDERDAAFAHTHGLPIKEVVRPYVVDKVNVPRSDKKTVIRQNVHAIVFDSKQNRYLILRNAKHGWDTVVIGGIEENEDPVEAAKREVAEETGYVDLRFVRILGNPVEAEYFAKHKDENRRAVATAVYFELVSEQRDTALMEKDEENEVLWIDPKDFIPGKMVNSELPHWLARIKQDTDVAYVGDGILVNSGDFDGEDNVSVKSKLIEAVGGRNTKTFRLKDWVFSRQRYWGEPIPIIHCEKCGAVGVPEKDLPVRLPDVEHYEPTGTGESPLANIKEWVETVCPQCSGPGRRETNTMPQWAGSSWYYLRYIDPKNEKELVNPKKEQFWMQPQGVDVYVGGAEHATRHLIYARFWHKFLFDLGVVSTPEPFSRLISVGLIMAEDGRKMSKRYGNIVNPDEIVDLYGADSLRIYEMFMGPFGDAIAWNTDNLIGARRFVERIWRLQEKCGDTTIPEVERELHRTIKKVAEDIRGFRFNTAISQMMIFLNRAEREGIGKKEYAAFLKLVAPFAPHIAEELWQKSDGAGSIHESAWPEHDETKLIEEKKTIAVQVGGKARATIEITLTEPEEIVLARARDAVQKWIANKVIKKEMYVPGKIVNIIPLE